MVCDDHFSGDDLLVQRSVIDRVLMTHPSPHTPHGSPRGIKLNVVQPSKKVRAEVVGKHTKAQEIALTGAVRRNAVTRGEMTVNANK